MSLAALVAVGLLGGAGAVARLLVDGAVWRRAAGAFASGILAVNLSGTLLLGVLAGPAVGAGADRLLAGALLGAYTTFSTWVYDSHRLAVGGRRGLALANLVASLVLGLAAVQPGRTVGSAL